MLGAPVLAQKAGPAVVGWLVEREEAGGADPVPLSEGQLRRRWLGDERTGFGDRATFLRQT